METVFGIFKKRAPNAIVWMSGTNWHVPVELIVPACEKCSFQVDENIRRFCIQQFWWAQLRSLLSYRYIIEKCCFTLFRHESNERRWPMYHQHLALARPQMALAMPPIWRPVLRSTAKTHKQNERKVAVGKWDGIVEKSQQAARIWASRSRAHPAGHWSGRSKRIQHMHGVRTEYEVYVRFAFSVQWRAAVFHISIHTSFQLPPTFQFRRVGIRTINVFSFGTIHFSATKRVIREHKKKADERQGETATVDLQQQHPTAEEKKTSTQTNEENISLCFSFRSTECPPTADSIYIYIN